MFNCLVIYYYVTSLRKTCLVIEPFVQAFLFAALSLTICACQFCSIISSCGQTQIRIIRIVKSFEIYNFIVDALNVDYVVVKSAALQDCWPSLYRNIAVDLKNDFCVLRDSYSNYR